MLENLLITAILLVPRQIPSAQEPKSDITEKEATEFARRIERDQAAGRERAFDALFDFEGLIEDASLGLELTAQEKSDFIKGARKSSMGAQISAAGGNSYRCLRSRVIDGRRVLTFRLWSEQGLNYHDLRLKKTPGGLRIADNFIYLSGESTLSIMRRGTLAIAANDPVRRKKVPEWAVDFLNNMRKILEFQREARSERPQDALKTFAGFPESLRKDRMIQVLRILAAAKVGDKEFLEAEAEYSRHFPEDSCKDLICFDALILRKDFPAALKSIDRIDKSVGGDPLLNFHRGTIHLEMGKVAESRAFGLKAAKDVPYLQEPRWLLVTVALNEKEHAETVKLLEGLERDFKLVMENFDTIPDYADFVKSREYRDWLKSRASK